MHTFKRIILRYGVKIFFVVVDAAAMMSAIYEENKDEDGFLYMTYSGENTFGSLWNRIPDVRRVYSPKHLCKWSLIYQYLSTFLKIVSSELCDFLDFNDIILWWLAFF